ncbi:MAG: polysaccharide deacetylase family protein [Pseudonocardia sp.]
MAATASTLMVLGWHNVEGSWCFPAPPGVGARGLARQLNLLRRVTNIVPLRQALRDLREGRPLPPRALAVTFDDGYADNLTIAGPLLRRLGIPATCFLVPGILDGDVVPWWERLGWAFARSRATRLEWEGRSWELPGGGNRAAFKEVSALLKLRDRAARESAVDALEALLEPSGEYRHREQFLDWEGARRLGEYMDLGSHTMWHCILSQESPQAQKDDLVQAREQLSQRLGGDFDVLAYPNGTRADYDETTMAGCAAAGYEFAVTTRGGWNRSDTPCYEIRRWVINPERGEVDLAKILRDRVRRAARPGYQPSPT